jgi:Fic family protein
LALRFFSQRITITLSVLTATAIEPIIPEQRLAVLLGLAQTVLREAAKLELEQIGAGDAGALAVQWESAYFSNWIEGIDVATEPALAAAHLAAQQWTRTHEGQFYAPAFICEIHRRLFVDQPEPGNKGPGQLRISNVRAGEHIAPPGEIVPALLRHFCWRYENVGNLRETQLLAAVASHHRMAWIHPFRDGNGRVARLHTQAVLNRLGVARDGWSLSRGLALRRQEYYAHLANADQVRSSRGATDGRGHLSELRLAQFCEFMLKTIIAEISSRLSAPSAGGDYAPQ